MTYQSLFLDAFALWFFVTAIRFATDEKLRRITLNKKGARAPFQL